jgi:hypothetical protein
MLLTATTHSIELATTNGSSVDYVASYVDYSTTAFTPGSSQGNVAAVAETSIVSAPSAGLSRHVKEIQIVNRDAATTTVFLQKDVSGTEFVFTPDVTLESGEALHYNEGKGLTVLDAQGRTKTVQAVTSIAPTLTVASNFATTNLTTAEAIADGDTYAVYMGRAPRYLASVSVRYRVTIAAVAITWAEVAIATGAPNLGGAPTLTPRGHANVAAVVNSTGQKTTTVSVAAGQTIQPGDDVWVLIGNDVTTTAMSVRALSVGDDITAGFQATATTRPSTNIGTPVAFSAVSNTANAPWVAIQW